MKKKMVSVLLTAAMGATALVGFGTTAYADDDVLELYQVASATASPGTINLLLLEIKNSSF